jgi:carbon storage regulator
MLVLTRKTDEEIILSGEIRVRVLSIRGSRVRLGIDAPRDVSVARCELQSELAGGCLGNRAGPLRPARC